MKTLFAATLFAAIFAAYPALSADRFPDRTDRAAAEKHAHSAASQTDPPLSRMRDRMKAMQEQMDQLRATADPAERQRLLDEHMQSMRETMSTLHGMGGPMLQGMMGDTMAGGEMMCGKRCGMMGGMMGGAHQHDAPKQPGRPSPETMEQRMDVMQMMMDQMMQHSQAEHGAPAK